MFGKAELEKRSRRKQLDGYGNMPVAPHELRHPNQRKFSKQFKSPDQNDQHIGHSLGLGVVVKANKDLPVAHRSEITFLRVVLNDFSNMVMVSKDVNLGLHKEVDRLLVRDGQDRELTPAECERAREIVAFCQSPLFQDAMRANHSELLYDKIRTMFKDLRAPAGERTLWDKRKDKKELKTAAPPPAAASQDTRPKTQSSSTRSITQPQSASKPRSSPATPSTRKTETRAVSKPRSTRPVSAPAPPVAKAASTPTERPVGKYNGRDVFQGGKGAYFYYTPSGKAYLSDASKREKIEFF